ncbi:hypothetical protein PILCRDRAFT_38549, partial [Piloderma croceum F 1598]
IIADPKLLLSPEALYKTGSMDGEVWEHPDAFYAVHALVPRLPHLRGAMIVFFEGAVDKWLSFTTKFTVDGVIASASGEEWRWAYMAPTNDVNEGGLGEKQIQTRHAPNMTLESHNAHTMYRKNNTAGFIHKTLSPADLKYLRRKAWEIDSSG